MKGNFEGRGVDLRQRVFSHANLKVKYRMMKQLHLGCYCMVNNLLWSKGCSTLSSYM